MRITQHTPRPAIAAGLAFLTPAGGASASATFFVVVSDALKIPYHVHATRCPDGLWQVDYVGPAMRMTLGPDWMVSEISFRVTSEFPIGGVANRSFALPVRSSPAIAVAPSVAGIARETARIHGLLAPLADPQRRYRLTVDVADAVRPVAESQFNYEFEIVAVNREVLDRQLENGSRRWTSSSAPPASSPARSRSSVSRTTATRPPGTCRSPPRSHS
ncbi:hypothetical protein [Aureimonas psammosilenae]|uniref:hypothetical protein n=1 Tax=Aureimonas psammosilenae TaxID=2495496 RepID=UPI0012608A7A|nr:hypothetical protein [Aureimonas psammosilenae]